MKPELLDGAGLAALLKVEPATVSKYAQRKRIPAPDYVLGGRPVWLRSTIDAWVRQGKPSQADMPAATDWEALAAVQF